MDDGRYRTDIDSRCCWPARFESQWRFRRDASIAEGSKIVSTAGFRRTLQNSVFNGRYGCRWNFETIVLSTDWWACPRWTLVINGTCTPVFSVPKSQGIQHPRSGCSLPRLTWFPGVRRSANPSGFASRQPGSLGGETSQSTGVIPEVRLRRPRTSGHHFRRFVKNRARQLSP
jgi:hypothetical protein